MVSIFLSRESEATVYLYLYILFGFSMVLNLISLFLIIRRTPPNQTVVRKYLIAIQVSLIAVDVNFDIGMHAVPVFPALAGYGTGLIMKTGVSFQLGFAIQIDLYIVAAIAIFFCVVYRHQTVIQPGNAFKFSKNTRRTVEVIVAIVSPIPAIVWAYLGKDQASIDAIIVRDLHCIEWIRDRGFYYADERTVATSCFILFVIVAIIILALLGVIIFFHMFYTLRQNSSKRSLKAMNLIKRSIVNLLIQIGIPYCLFVAPALVIILGLQFESLFTFETLLIFYLILPLHSFGHNLILLMINSTYRRLLMSLFRRYLLCKNIFVSRTSVFYVSSNDRTILPQSKRQ